MHAPSSNLPHNLQHINQHTSISDQTLNIFLQQQQLRQQQQLSLSCQSVVPLHMHPLLNGHNKPSTEPSNQMQNNMTVQYLQLQAEQAVQSQPHAAQAQSNEQQQQQKIQYLQLEHALLAQAQSQQSIREGQMQLLQQYHLGPGLMNSGSQLESQVIQPIFQSSKYLSLRQPDHQPSHEPLNLSFMLDEGQFQMNHQQRNARMSDETDEEGSGEEEKTLDKKDKRRKKNRIAQRNFRSRQRQMLHDSAIEVDGLKARIREMERIILDQQLQINRLSVNNKAHAIPDGVQGN